jgi:hypothetical protein
MEILASLGEAANSCAAGEDSPGGQKATAGAVADRSGGRGNRRSPGLGRRLSRSGVDEGEPPRAERLGQ